MKKFAQFFWRRLIDLVGVLLIIASILFGWLPGVGGIPLFLAGLGLLAINHDWAKRLLEKCKNMGVHLGEFIFRDHPLIVVIYDILALLIISSAIVIITNYTNSLVRASAIFFIFAGFGLFLGNRKRLTRLTKVLKKHIRK